MTRSNEGGAAGAAEGIAAPASDSSASKEAEAQAAGAADISPPPPLQELIGRCVRLDGLQSKPELNGLTGSCVGLDLATGRVTVTIGAAKSFNVKPENVISVSVELRAEVEGRVLAAKARAVELIEAGEKEPTTAKIHEATVQQLMTILSGPWAANNLHLAFLICCRLAVLGMNGPLADEIRPLMSVSEASLAAVRGLVDAALMTIPALGEQMEHVPKELLIIRHTLTQLCIGFGASAAMMPTEYTNVLAGANWMETELGCKYQTMLCEAGAIKACVFALENGDVSLSVSFSGILRSVLFGSDGREGHNSPAAAAARREHAAAAGAIEALVSQIKLVAKTPASGLTLFPLRPPDRTACSTSLKDCSGEALPLSPLSAVFTGMTRLIMGFEDDGAGYRRRQRMAALGAIEALVAVADVHFSPYVFQRTLDVALIMAGKGKGVSLAQEDKQIKARWDRATAGSPGLRVKLMQMMTRGAITPAMARHRAQAAADAARRNGDEASARQIEEAMIK